MTVVEYFIALIHRLCSVVELLKEVINWCGWIPPYIHAIKIGCEFGGVDGSVLSVYVRKNIKRFTLAKLGDEMFESGHVFFWTLFSNHEY